MASNITTLVEKAKQGDADAFSTLYQMYYPKMKGICINILREDKAVVDDLVQDAFILAFVSLKDLKNTHRFSQWLTSITTNLVLKYQEKGKRYDFISLSDIEDEFSSVLEDGNTSKQSIPYEEIMAAIDSLPEGYKKIFNMSVLDGLSHQEISELLDIEKDYLCSGHRAHGLSIMMTGQPEILLGEIMGKKFGMAKGLGGSQHVYYKNYFKVSFVCTDFLICSMLL